MKAEAETSYPTVGASSEVLPRERPKTAYGGDTSRVKLLLALFPCASSDDVTAETCLAASGLSGDSFLRSPPFIR